MPRWARFLSCSFTGFLVSLVGLFVAAYLYEGNSAFWQGAINFAGSPAFWSLAGLVGLLMVGALLLARLLVRLYRLTGGLAGLLSGAALALLYATFLVATHAWDWGGFLHKAWPAALVFALPFALAGGFATWLWDRLD